MIKNIILQIRINDSFQNKTLPSSEALFKLLSRGYLLGFRFLCA